MLLKAELTSLANPAKMIVEGLPTKPYGVRVLLQHGPFASAGAISTALAFPRMMRIIMGRKVAFSTSMVCAGDVTFCTVHYLSISCGYAGIFFFVSDGPVLV